MSVYMFADRICPLTLAKTVPRWISHIHRRPHSLHIIRSEARFAHIICGPEVSPCLFPVSHPTVSSGEGHIALDSSNLPTRIVVSEPEQAVGPHCSLKRLGPSSHFEGQQSTLYGQQTGKARPGPTDKVHTYLGLHGPCTQQQLRSEEVEP